MSLICPIFSTEANKDAIAREGTYIKILRVHSPMLRLAELLPR